MEVAGLFGLQAEVSWLHSCYAQFKAAEVWWWAGVFWAMTCQGFFSLVVVVVGIFPSLSLSHSIPHSFLPAFFLPLIPLSPFSLVLASSSCSLMKPFYTTKNQVLLSVQKQLSASTWHPSQWKGIRREVNIPLIHLQQHLMPLEGVAQSAFISVSAASSVMVLSSHKQDLWKENDVNTPLM